MDIKFAETSGQCSVLLSMNTFCTPEMDNFNATVPIPWIFSEAPAFDEVPDISPSGR